MANKGVMIRETYTLFRGARCRIEIMLNAWYNGNTRRRASSKHYSMEADVLALPFVTIATLCSATEHRRTKPGCETATSKYTGMCYCVFPSAGRYKKTNKWYYTPSRRTTGEPNPVRDKAKAIITGERKTPETGHGLLRQARWELTSCELVYGKIT